MRIAWIQFQNTNDIYVSGQSDTDKKQLMNECPNVGGVCIRSRDGAPSRIGCVVNGKTTKAKSE